MTQLEMAQKGLISPEMEQAAALEGISAEHLRELIALGQAVIPKNLNHRFANIMAIGNGLRTKVNANIGTSGECTSLQGELEKLDAAVAAGTDSVMDLSTGGDLQEIRRQILAHSPVMVGAVPIYAVATELQRGNVPISRMDPDDLFRSIEEQCAEGLDYITVHCGVTLEVLRATGKLPAHPALGESRRIDPHALDEREPKRKPAL